MRDCPLNVLAAPHIRMLRDRKAATPGAANNRLKYLSAMFGWAVEDGRLRSNLVRDVRRLRYASKGFGTWTVADVRRFEARHPVGTKAFLALALLLYLGVRRGDAVRLGPKMLSETTDGDGSITRQITFVVRKTRYRRQTETVKPILPVLWSVIQATPCGRDTFVETEYRKPFTAAGFGGWFRVRCDEAGLPECTAHGLRKAGATLAAENGATDRQLMALYDWTAEKQANVYTAAANRKRLAAEAARLIAQSVNTAEAQSKNVPAPPNCPTTEKSQNDNGLEKSWQEWRDSNPQPPVLETGALAIELHS